MNTEPEILFSLYLIRHGQTVHNLSRPAEPAATLREKHNPVLTEEGKKQAVALGEFFSQFRFDRIYVSGLDRALMTADALRKHQAPEMPLILKPDLAEVATDFEYMGELFSRIKTNYSPIVLAEGYGEFPTLISDGKHDDAKIFERAKKNIDYFCKKHKNGEHIAVVAHAGIITYMLYALQDFSKKCPPADFEISNTGVTKITFYRPGTFRDDIVIEYVNSTRHLPFVF